MRILLLIVLLIVIGLSATTFAVNVWQAVNHINLPGSALVAMFVAGSFALLCFTVVDTIRYYNWMRREGLWYAGWWKPRWLVRLQEGRH